MSFFVACRISGRFVTSPGDTEHGDTDIVGDWKKGETNFARTH